MQSTDFCYDICGQGAGKAQTGWPYREQQTKTETLTRKYVWTSGKRHIIFQTSEWARGTPVRPHSHRVCGVASFSLAPPYISAQ